MLDSRQRGKIEGGIAPESIIIFERIRIFLRISSCVKINQCMLPLFMQHIDRMSSNSTVVPQESHPTISKIIAAGRVSSFTHF